MNEQFLSSVKNVIMDSDSFKAFYTCAFEQSPSKTLKDFIRAEQIADKNMKNDIISGNIYGAVVVVLYISDIPTKVMFFIDKDYRDNDCVNVKYLTVTCHKFSIFSKLLSLDFGTKTIDVNRLRLHGPTNEKRLFQIRSV